MNSQVSIIVLNYNGLFFLEKCLQSINKQTYQNIETIVVDNNSTDNSFEYVKDFPSAVLIKNEVNYGYSRANNIAAKRAKGDFLLFLNNDTELFPDVVEELVKTYRDKSILAPTQIITSAINLPGSAGNGMDIFGYPFGASNPSKTKIFYADGAAIFIKKKDFFRIGMFDEKLFLFQEDIDLSWRAWMMGYRVISCQEAKLYHYSGGAILGGAGKNGIYESSYFRRYLNEKNVIRNIIKNFSLPLCFVVLFFLMVLHLIEIFTLLLLMKLKVVGCYLKAYQWNILNLKDTLAFRKKVQSKRIISDLLLMKKMHLSYSKFVAFLRVGLPKFK